MFYKKCLPLRNVELSDILRIEKYPSWIFKFGSHDEVVIFVPDDITGTGCGEEYMFSNQTKF